MRKPIKVLVVDDAIVVRILVGNTISKDPDLEFVGKAENGKVALEKIDELHPDVIVLDIEMPEMDGLEVLKVLKERGMPTKAIMFSTYTTVGAKHTFEALELGAVDFVPKPSSAGFSKGFENVREELLAKIKFVGSSDSTQPMPKIRRSASSMISSASTGFEVVMIEGGMGAPKTFMNIIPQLPEQFTPGILIFQSMFAGFAEQFVRRLAKSTHIPMKAGEHDDMIQSGHGFVLFGDRYVATKRSGTSLQLAFREKDDAEKYGTVPRILCESLAKTCGKKAIGVLLAGAGEGNLEGIYAMKNQGALIFAEEPSSLIGQEILNQFLERSLIDEIVPSHELVPTLTRSLGLSK
ncbi:MAG: chemotaxis protein CheB [Candidatus Vecturithrix sp.]|nr:chemotaxis protein CheB [Candidatus Vecturithrix sp.]